MDLLIDSGDRSSGDLQTAFYTITKPVIGTKAALVGAWFYFTAYPVSAHSVIFYEGGSTVTPFTASVAAGNYSTTTYASALQTAMNAVAGIANTYTVTYNATTAKFTIVAVASSVALASTNTALSQRYTGFTTQSFGTTITGATVANLSPPLFIDIRMGSAQGGVGVQGLAFVGRVPINAAFGSQVVYENHQLPTYFDVSGISNSMQIAIVDSNGTAFTNQSNYLLKFHYI